MPYAILQDEKINGQSFKTIAEIVDEETEGAILCSSAVKVGDVHDGYSGFMSRSGVERGKPERTLADAMAEKISAVEEHARTMRTSIAGGDSSKRDVYQIKYEFAVAALAGSSTALHALTQEALARGETPMQLARLVKRLGDNWRMAGMQIDAAYQMHKSKITALASIEEVDAYSINNGWPS